MNYAKAIKFIRTTRGLSQKDLATLLGVSSGYLSKIESGQRKPTTTVIETICDKTGVPYHLFALLASDKEVLDQESSSDIEAMKKELLTLVLN